MFSSFFLTEYARQRQAEILEIAEQARLARLAAPASRPWRARIAGLLVAAGRRLGPRSVAGRVAQAMHRQTTPPSRDIGSSLPLTRPSPQAERTSCTSTGTITPFSTHRP